MVKFNKKSMRESMNLAKEGKSRGGGTEVGKGVYLCTLRRIGFRTADSGAVSFNCGFQVDEDAEEYANLYIWHNINIQKKDGDENEIGVDQMNQLLHKMSEGAIDVDAFIDDPEQHVEKFLGTEVKVSVNPKTDDKTGFTDSRCKVLTVLKNVYGSNEMESNQDEADQDNEPEEKTSSPSVDEDDDGVSIQIGDLIVYEDENDRPRKGTVINFIEDLGKVLIQPSWKNSTPISVDGDKLLLHPEYLEHREKLAAENTSFKEEEEEEEEEEESEPQLREGATVKYQWKGETLEGKVHSLENGMVKFRIVKGGEKTVIRKVSEDAVKVVTPF